MDTRPEAARDYSREEEPVEKGAVKQVRTQEVIVSWQREGDVDEAIDMWEQNGTPIPADAPSRPSTHQRSSVSATIKVLIAISLGIVAMRFLWQAVVEGNWTGGITMAIVLIAVAAGIPFLVQDWRLTKTD